MKHFVYILKSEKLNRFYIGYTTNIQDRLEFHRNAEPHKFTAKADDWILVHSIECGSKTQALNIEKHIKNMKSKKFIENLMEYPEIQQKLLTKYTSNC